MSELVQKLRTRASIRRGIPRGEPDRISNDLEAAADRIEALERQIAAARKWYDEEFRDDPAITETFGDLVYPWDEYT